MNTQTFEKIYKIAESARLAEMASPTTAHMEEFVKFLKDTKDFDLLDFFQNKVRKQGSTTIEDIRNYRRITTYYYSLYPEDERRMPHWTWKASEEGHEDEAFSGRGWDNNIFNVNAKHLKATE